MKRMSDQLNSDDTRVGDSSNSPAEKIAKGEVAPNQPCATPVNQTGRNSSGGACHDGVTKDASVNGDQSSENANEAGVSSSDQETISFNLVFGKSKYTMTEGLDENVTDFKESVAKLTGVPPGMQKLMFKGMLKDGQTLREAKLTAGCKIMLIGSTPTQVAAANTAPKPEELRQAEGQASAKIPLCKQKQHIKVLEKGMPEDVLPGIKNARDSLPLYPISGMINKSGSKVRLTFKLEVDQVWVGTKERTDKIVMSQIKDIVSEPIEGHEEYHIMGLQLGPTEASLYWLYWVPAQYVAAIKEAVLG